MNNLVYWLSQIVGSISIGALLDQKSISRRVRAFSGWSILFAMVFIVHIWAFFYQKYAFAPPLLLPLPMLTMRFPIPGTIRENLSPLTHTKSTSSITGTLDESGSTSSAAFWMPCGRPQHTGSWVPCRMTPPSWPTSLDSVIIFFTIELER